MASRIIVNAFIIWRLGALEHVELELLTPNTNSQNTQEPTLLVTQPRAPPTPKNPAPASP